MVNFYSILAKAIVDAAPSDAEREGIVELLWGAHQHHNVELNVGLYSGLEPETVAWLKPVIDSTSETYRRQHPRDQVPNFDSARDGAYIQDLAENVSRVSREFYMQQRGRLK